jgi:deazaflavin-dependent oxidoreductase (nitroreductase family)
MPAPRSIARFNKRFTNKLTSKVAAYLPGFAIVSHVGRRSGLAYRTPVNAFHTDDGYIIALTYGAQSDWVKNVMAAGSCELQSRGRRVRLISPHIETDKSKSWAPLPVRLILSLIDAPQYMRLSLERASIGSTRNTTALDTEVHDTLCPTVAKEIADDKYTTDSESDQRRRRSR